jgi:hypothetical protein
MATMWVSSSENLIWNGYRYFVIGIDCYEQIYY